MRHGSLHYPTLTKLLTPRFFPNCKLYELLQFFITHEHLLQFAEAGESQRLFNPTDCCPLMLGSQSKVLLVLLL